MLKLVKYGMVAVLGVLYMTPAAASQVVNQPDWENEQVIGIYKEPAHVTTIFFRDIETVLQTGRKESPFFNH